MDGLIHTQIRNMTDKINQNDVRKLSGIKAMRISAPSRESLWHRFCYTRKRSAYVYGTMAGLTRRA